MSRDIVESYRHTQLFQLLVKRVDLENAIAYVNAQISEKIAWLSDKERDEIYKAVDAYFAPDCEE